MESNTLFGINGLSTEICHYGIKGQKWGVRHYQNPDGSLTPAGRERYGSHYDQYGSRSTTKKIKNDVREEREKSFEEGRTASILEGASRRSEKRLNKYIKKYSKNPTEKNKERMNLALTNHISIDAAYKAQHEKIKKHVSDLRSTYGNKAVKDIKYNKKGRVDERVVTNRAIIASVVSVLANLQVSMLGSSVAVYVVPKNKALLGNSLERKGYMALAAVNRAQKKKLKEESKRNLKRNQNEFYNTF